MSKRVPAHEMIKLAPDAIREMVAQTGSTLAAVSEAMGRQKGYLGQAIAGGRCLTSDDLRQLQAFVRDPSGLPKRKRPGGKTKVPTRGEATSPRPSYILEDGAPGRVERRLGCGTHRWQEVRRGAVQAILQCQDCGRYDTRRIQGS